MQYSGVVADSCTITRLGTAALLEEMGIRVVAKFKRGHDVLQCLSDREPGLLVTETKLPGLEKMGVVRQAWKEGLVGKGRPTEVLLLTTEARDPWVQEAFRFGASGYVLKSEPTKNIEIAVKEVLYGNKCLSPMLLRS